MVGNHIQRIRWSNAVQPFRFGIIVCIQIYRAVNCEAYFTLDVPGDVGDVR